MMITSASVISMLGPAQCQFCHTHTESISCSTSYGASSSLVKSSFQVQRTSDHLETRCKNDFFGSVQFHWLPLGRKMCSTKVSVAADYSDSVPDSSDHVWKKGYHPLEDLEDRKTVPEAKLTSAEIAKTTLEAYSSALIIFPGTVHCEPHKHISWSEYQYLIDEYGDIFFQIPEDENVLQDCGGLNPVNSFLSSVPIVLRKLGTRSNLNTVDGRKLGANVIIGMDVSLIEKRRLAVAEHSIIESGSNDCFPFNDNAEVDDSDMFDWRMLDTSSSVHPIFFAKCMTKAINMKYAEKMDHPSNGVSILGYLRPAFADEQLYLQSLFNGDESDGERWDWNDEDSGLESGDGETYSGSTIYRLDIMRVDLLSVYGVQSAISARDLRDADPDILIHSTPEIIERFRGKGERGNLALRALCIKNGIMVEDASLIGVDSLGMDVRVYAGRQAQTHRFPFKTRATSQASAEKQIQNLLFPRQRRKKNRD